MTGIAEIYLCLRNPNSKDARARVRSLFSRNSKDRHIRFVVLSWKRTGSNLLCGILHHHPDIVMHNEVFNPIDIFTYYPKALILDDSGTRWNTLARDLHPEPFLQHIWSGKMVNEDPIKPSYKAVGFKSFPDHWIDVRNEHVCQKHIIEDFQVKKVVLYREDELAVFVSMMRAEVTGRYMTVGYPEGLALRIDPARFQAFVNNYRFTYRRKYRSPMEKRDTFRVTYEQILEEKTFANDILPLLWSFLGVKPSPMKKLRETVRQSPEDEDLRKVIENYAELEFCFRHTDVIHFVKHKQKSNQTDCGIQDFRENIGDNDFSDACIQPMEAISDGKKPLESWSILLPICSRFKIQVENSEESGLTGLFNSNRFIDLSLSSQHKKENGVDPSHCWGLLERFANTLRATSSDEQLEKTECIVGIDIDDLVFNSDMAKRNIKKMLEPCHVIFDDIPPVMYGKVCAIWNKLAKRAINDFLVLLGDDIELLDCNWQFIVSKRFKEISDETGLPYGAACVALCDTSFPGFPTFPVLHRWHMNKFGSFLPRQFVNQGGDPYLFELYSRFNAASFVNCRLHNTIGGDANARYKKYEINWRGQILTLNLVHLQEYLGDVKPKGICMDVVVPSFRTNNNEILRKIVHLRASIKAYVRFWIVVDNPDPVHITDVKELADICNQGSLLSDSNYFINVVHYGENRGASAARNYGYNYSTAEWVLFLDDDVVPETHLLDAYIGSIFRYPDAKVFVGLTTLPPSSNMWTKSLRTCNIMFFYGAAEEFTYPPWGVTANLMVAGSRHNQTIQFKSIYPKTGGGEDIDFVFQFKEWYSKIGNRLVVGVPGAKAHHSWWNQGKSCYRQINGWAWGDSICITEWPDKTYLTCPNWIEFIGVILFPLAFCKGEIKDFFFTAVCIVISKHIFLALIFFRNAKRFEQKPLQACVVSFIAATVVTAQEATRFFACLSRLSVFSLFRRMDWNDGQQPNFILDAKLRSIIGLLVDLLITSYFFFGKSFNGDFPMEEQACVVI